MDSQYARPPPNPDVYQTPDVDLKATWDAASARNKTFVITGGLSGIGAGIATQLAALGGTVVIGDLQDGAAFVKELRHSSGNENVHAVKCDVTDYKSQCDLFRAALELSPKKAIDGVIANAGISEIGQNFHPKPFTPGQADDPPPPVLTTLDVNLTGVVYTAYLALQYFRNHPHLPSSSFPSAQHDRSLVLVGSIASLYPLTHAPFYNASKHAVLGLFRSLRQTALPDHVRINLLCPYWIETPIVPVGAKILLAGSDFARMEDVVAIGTRCLADCSVAGHIFLILPASAGGVVEILNDEPRELDAFNRNAVRTLNQIATVNGWLIWGRNLVYALLGWYRPS
ncbi:hypothetical protein ABW21_db0206436 [Orbilia brochopaga]|nr:hypothetical protein ABW21_db0206436 [Drechslerella brochopaga]